MSNGKTKITEQEFSKRFKLKRFGRRSTEKDIKTLYRKLNERKKLPLTKKRFTSNFEHYSTVAKLKTTPSKKPPAKLDKGDNWDALMKKFQRTADPEKCADILKRLESIYERGMKKADREIGPLENKLERYDRWRQMVSELPKSARQADAQATLNDDMNTIAAQISSLESTEQRNQIEKLRGKLKVKYSSFYRQFRSWNPDQVSKWAVLNKEVGGASLKTDLAEKLKLNGINGQALDQWTDNWAAKLLIPDDETRAAFNVAIEALRTMAPDNPKDEDVMLSNECAICMERAREYAFKPCNHYRYCKICVERIFESDKTCAVCKEPVTEFFRVF